MKMNRMVLALILLLVVSRACPGANGDALYQVSTIDALLDGVYDGEVTLGELRSHGDIGIGTLNKLDGEMVLLDGRFYQVTSDGRASVVPESAKSPFAAVTVFHPEQRASINGEMDLSKLTQYLDSLASSPNFFYIIRIDGTFKSVRVRSVPKQSKPYPRLVDVTAKQPTFDLREVKGTLVGVRCPYFVKSVNMPGYHFHFLTQDRAHGGHLLDCVLHGGTIKVDAKRQFELVLPTSDEFQRVGARSGTDKELEAAEKSKK